MTINRTQALVLGFFVLVWVSLVAIFALAPEVYYRAMKFSSAGVGLLFLVGISAFIALLVVGVIRRWRWTFWLIAFAFLFGVLRIPASVLALAGISPRTDRPGTCSIRGSSARGSSPSPCRCWSATGERGRGGHFEACHLGL